ncbi:MAG: Na(+)-translocating NADH-quinone reductase subunit B [Spirochaetes bacterium ADurb.BinA120]|nr:MAG: Na(+)-translocating NADH-quinone reductase subunit B [Spirochaetes bacterium ADurb.BinA120]
MKTRGRIRSMFEKGGSLERLWPLLDAAETFLFRLPARTSGGAHIRDAYDLKRMMMIVVLALFPCMAFGTYNVGYQFYASAGIAAGHLDCLIKGLWVVVPLYAVTFAVGGFWEAFFALVRGEEINEGFFVTGTLIPLVMPPTIPLWQLALAVSFGVVLGKELFGGTGMNVFNPALVSRAFLFFAYPKSISGAGVWVLKGDRMVDAVSGATPLHLGIEPVGDIVPYLSSNGFDFWRMFSGLEPGSIGETSVIAILMGAALLLVTRVASWRIMLSVFAGGAAMALLCNAFAPSPASMLALPAHYHFVMGGFAFGAVFMATDPVSAAGTNAGKFIYGFLIGVLAVLVRTLNPAYPEGMMLAILFMNLFSPLIDYMVVRLNMRRRRLRAAG